MQRAMFVIGNMIYNLDIVMDKKRNILILFISAFAILLSTLIVFNNICGITYINVNDYPLEDTNSVTLNGAVKNIETTRDYDGAVITIQILKTDKPIKIEYRSNMGFIEKYDNVTDIQIKSTNNNSLEEENISLNGKLKSGNNKSFGKDSYTDFILITE